MQQAGDDHGAGATVLAARSRVAKALPSISSTKTKCLKEISLQLQTIIEEN